MQGHLSEGRRIFDGILARRAGQPKELRALALVHGAIFPFRQGELGLQTVRREAASTRASDRPE